jgi:hypothetical protein
MKLDIQYQVVIIIVFSEHAHAILDDKVVGIFLTDAELENIDLFLASHSQLFDDNRHLDWVFAFLLLLNFPFIRGDSLDIDLLRFWVGLSPHIKLDVEFGNSFSELELLKVIPSFIFFQLAEFEAGFIYSTRAKDGQEGKN